MTLLQVVCMSLSQIMLVLGEMLKLLPLLYRSAFKWLCSFVAWNCHSCCTWSRFKCKPCHSIYKSQCWIRLPTHNCVITNGHDQISRLDIESKLASRSNEFPKYEKSVIPSSLMCTWPPLIFHWWEGRLLELEGIIFKQIALRD